MGRAEKPESGHAVSAFSLHLSSLFEMRFRFVWPGKTKDEHLRSLVADYLKRLSRFAKVEVAEIRETSRRDSAAKAGEAQRIVESVVAANVVVVLDENAREFTSIQLADQIRRWENDSVKEVVIVIGGPEGLGEAVKARAGALWRVSRLTLTHEMARVVIIEQLYRAYTINRGLPYQK